MHFCLWTADLFGIFSVFYLEERESHVEWTTFCLAVLDYGGA